MYNLSVNMGTKYICTYTRLREVLTEYYYITSKLLPIEDSIKITHFLDGRSSFPSYYGDVDTCTSQIHHAINKI